MDCLAALAHRDPAALGELEEAGERLEQVVEACLLGGLGKDVEDACREWRTAIARFRMEKGETT